MQVPRSAQDFACGLPLRSRPHYGSSSNPAAPTTIAWSSDCMEAVARSSLALESLPCMRCGRGPFAYRRREGLSLTASGFEISVGSCGG